jgi:hypothetical protein
MTMLPQNDEDLLERLRAHQVEFVIIGGLCVVIHGAPTVTRDVDICCQFAPENLRRLEAAVKDLHPIHRMTPNQLPFELDDRLCRELRNLYLRTDLGLLDCLGEVTGVGGFEDAVRLSVPCLSGRFRMLSLDAIIAAKEATGRRRDFETVHWLRSIKERKAPSKK